jgi:twinkle protein
VESDLNFVLKSYRGIDQDVVEKFNVLTGVDDKGEDIQRVYHYPTHPKTRIIEGKRFVQPAGAQNVTLFGQELWNAGSSKFITVVEGEDDALAAYQMLGKKFPVVAVPGASLSQKLLKSVHSYLDAFQNIVIAFDGDDAGNNGARKLAEAFPNKAYRVSLTTHKDACDYLKAGDERDFLFAWHNRTKYVPEWDVNTPDQFLRILDEGQDWRYVPTGIQAYDEIALGLMQGGLTVFTAPEGIGKTEFMRMLEWQIASEYPDMGFAYCHMEETNMRSILGLASYKLQRNVTRRALFDDIDTVKGAIRELTERENIHQFHIGVDEDPEVLLDRVRYYATVCDCKYIFFEPIQDLAHQRNAGQETAEQLLSRISVQLSRIASETGVGIITIAHQNDNGEIRDCRLIGKQAAVRVDLSRNIMSTDEDDRNTTTLTVVKNRPVGPTGFAGQLKFDPESFTLREKVY